MDDLTQRRPTNQFAGDGWLLSGGVRLGQVTYVINVYEVRTARDDQVAGTELTVGLRNHSITAAQTHGQPVTLRLYDGRQVRGFLSEDGASLVRTGAIT
jgi:hypothetical protein